MMDPARGEFDTIGMTGAPTNATDTPDSTISQIVRTRAKGREKTPAPSAPPVQLHREEDVGAVAETVGACKRACQGMAYDIRHWNDLPSQSTAERMRIVATRGGRLPYLVLTVAIAFLVFFSVMHAVKWMARGRNSTMYDIRPTRLPLHSTPMPTPGQRKMQYDTVVGPVGLPSPFMAPLSTTA